MHFTHQFAGKKFSIVYESDNVRGCAYDYDNELKKILMKIGGKKLNRYKFNFLSQLKLNKTKWLDDDVNLIDVSHNHKNLQKKYIAN